VSMLTLISVTKHALMITGFVAVMMLVIEYVNILTQGQWQKRLSHRRWGQYLLAAFLGATPGCLGAFAVVAMYTHRSLTLGAVVAAMIATSGDEAFVLFALVPKTALILTGVLFGIGLLSGALTDALLGRRTTDKLSCEADFSIHEGHCQCFPHAQLVSQWKNCTSVRAILTASLSLFLLALLFGEIGPHEWDWIRISLILVSSVGLFIVATVPDHFLEEHLWKHVICGHVRRVFLWTFGALLILHLFIEHLELGEFIEKGRWFVLALAGVIGLIPESGPHLIFVTLFSKGLIPLSILLTSSIVQDGHGMLPLLAHSPRTFILVKFINLLVGCAIGVLLMAFGF